MTISLDELAGLAQKATAGPWPLRREGQGIQAWVGDLGGQMICQFTSAHHPDRNAPFIAACDPATILRLLAVCKAAKDAQEWIIDAQTGNALDKALREIE